MKITVIGSGYVGLVVAACFAEVGNLVVCVDIDIEKINKLNLGEVPIYEPGIKELIIANQQANRLSFTSDIEHGVKHGECLFITVGTPQDKDGSADLKYVLNVANQIGTYMNEHKVIIDKSTVPVGTAEKVKKTIKQKLKDRGLNYKFSVVSNPEFLKEGAAIEDFRKPDRIVIGVEDDWSEQAMRQLYEPFNKNYDKLIVMDPCSAELTKYAANAMLATKISFMNEMANIAEKVGADIEKVRVGMGADHRIGYHFIYPGCGYGGSCFGKDVQALISTARENEVNAQLINAVDNVNKLQKLSVFEKVYNHYQGDIKGKLFAIWGLSFKPGTDDMRDAPSKVVIEKLLEHGAKLQVYDPQALDEAKRIYRNHESIVFCTECEDALEGADGLVVLTEWRVFRCPNFDKMKTVMKYPLIIDGRNMYDPKNLKAMGFSYYGIGR